MATQTRLFTLLGSKLGLQSEVVVKKGRELHRLLQLKTSANVMNISETCQIVVCLDLAASVIGVPFEKLDAIRLAGVTKKIYTSFRHTVEKLLGIGKCITIKDLCLQFGVSEAMPLAQKLLEKYVSEDARGMVEDLNHPMYNVAAVITACKHCKLKVDRVKLIDMSHIQKSAFLKLASTFEKYAKQLNPNPKFSSCSVEVDEYKPASLLKKMEILTKDSKMPSSRSTLSATSNLQSYEDWKRSILEDCNNVES
ncbi:origin recognition complex subunit 6 [Zootermopsis nevadensis]|uniref:Origin recognition complex subunit 6 n=1 Tax=Zootermopsis nevadensis TaxID=136037 RepID=A0A067R7J3_ZOONE|nr:origin recognition complex subunit 6 [Zootermopsis nevadensis]KDR18447.1 Origin recognition complex subunit 6 [Zootermopsis nevadensis]